MEFRKLSLMYAEGVSDLKARSRGWGVLVGSGVADVGFGKFTTKGEIQSRLSQKVSPPHKWSYWKIIFGCLVGLLVLEFILGYVDTVLRSGANFSQQLAWFGYGWLATIAFILFLAFRHNIWTVPNRRRLWDRSFMCHRCGHIVQRPQAEGGESQAIVREAPH